MDDSAPIKKHDFFRQINWEDLLAQRIEPPYKITVVSVCERENWRSSLLILGDGI